MQYLIMCRSLTYAQRAQHVLERSGVFAGLAKAPQGLTPGGCAWGVRVAERNGRRALAVLEHSAIKTGKVYALYDNGASEEAEL